MNKILTPNWNSKYIDKHRRGISDCEWANMQPNGEPNYDVGDIVHFKVGGSGVIVEVSEPQNGHPSSYSTRPRKDMIDHPDTKRAWHYEGDFK